MKMRSLIIDDEPLAHKVILEYAKDIPFIEIAAQSYLATEAFEILQQQEIDLIFLDIQMPKLKGLDFLRTLKNPPLAIVTSAYDEFALESFDLDVCDYLLKPFRFERFLKAVNKAVELMQLKQNPLPEQAATEIAQQLFIKSDKRFIQLDLTDVHYLESYGNYVKIWLKDEFHLTPRTLTSFAEQLSNTEFLRIHKSYIINKNYIDFVEGNMLHLKNDKQLAIGKSYKKGFMEIISKLQ